MSGSYFGPSVALHAVTSGGPQSVSYPLEVWQILVLGPVLSRGASHQVEDLVNLLHFAFA